MRKKITNATLLTLVLLLCCSAPLAANVGHAPLQEDELARFVRDLPFFLRWARKQGHAFQVYPQPETLFAPAHEQTTRQALQRAGWEPERFAFLLCATGAAATACAPSSCGRGLQPRERTLLERFMPRLLDAYGTGP